MTAADPTSPWRGSRRDPAVWVVALVALAMAAAFAAVRTQTQGGVHAFVQAGVRLSSPQAPRELQPFAINDGYDGQFVYRLSGDPLTRQRTADGQTIDVPPYRQERILLPASAWVIHAITPLSRGQSILAVNLLAVGLGGLAGALIARRVGRASWWGLILALQGGMLASLARDLNETLGWALLSCAVAAWLARRHGWASGLFVLAALARETTLFVVAGIGLGVLWSVLRQRDSWRRWLPEVLWLAPAPVVVNCWELYLRHVWGRLPATNVSDNIGVPFKGMVVSFWDGFTEPTRYYTDHPWTQVTWMVERFVLLALLVGAAAVVIRSRGAGGLGWLWVVAAGVAFSLHSWAYDIQDQRAAIEAMGASLIVLLWSRERWATWVLWAGAGGAALIAWEFVLNG